ncbi:MAG: hypothetical protein K9N23_16200 [Akkermansiaceae bacterium]|nr:hypothetical protein [Akkermansiaceae bacterium]
MTGQRVHDDCVDFTLAGDFGVAGFAALLAGLIGRYTTLLTTGHEAGSEPVTVERTE